MASKSNYQVIIIGAGVSGLSAANHLLKKCIDDFLIIEARNRIGGRVIAINIEGRQLELGANWIHGVLGNPIYEVASSNGLVPIVQTSRPHTVLAATQDGTRLPFNILQEMYNVYSTFLKRCEEYFLCCYLPPQGIESVGAHLRLERDLYLAQLPESQRHTRLLVFEYLMSRETCIIGSGDLDAVDLMEVGSYTELPGGNISVPTGFSSLLRPLTKDIPPNKIIKESPVSVIRWNHSCDSQDSSSFDTEYLESENKPMIEIVCDNGKCFYADSVICTLPLGVLKHSARTMFDPPLPESKLKSIEKLCYGTVDKIYLEYDRPFFSSELTELILLWEPIDDNEDIATRWYRKIYSFTKLNDTLLLGWISGDEAKYMETLPFDVVSEQCTTILRQFLADPCVPQPKRCICTSWYSQPYSRGSYSSIGVGGTQADITNVAQPLCTHHEQPVVLFAGEHCHPSFYSTVHGAYLSGRDAANTIAKQTTAQKQQPPLSTDTKAEKTVAEQSSSVDSAQSSDAAPKISEHKCSGAPTHDLTLDVEGTADLSSWLHGISLN